MKKGYIISAFYADYRNYEDNSYTKVLAIALSKEDANKFLDNKELAKRKIEEAFCPDGGCVNETGDCRRYVISDDNITVYLDIEEVTLL